MTYTRSPERNCLTRSVFTGASADDGRYEDLTGPQLADLPTDADELSDFVDAHPEGDNRGTRNRFMAVADIVRSGLASPQLRAAGLRVLAMTGDLTVRPHVTDGRGRPATAVEQRYDRGVETLFFDPATSMLLEERQADDDDAFHYSGIVLARRVVDQLPDLPRC